MESSSINENEMLYRNFDKCKGLPWSSWITPISPQKNEVKNEIVKDCRVTRLPKEDMGLFGLCPEHDRFCAVVCSTCGAIVKKQGLQRHQELRHNNGADLIILPPPQIPAKKIKSSHIKVKSKDSTPVSVHSNESILTPSVFQSAVYSKPIHSTSLPINTKQTSSKVMHLKETETTFSNTKRKSPNVNNEQNKAQRSKDKEQASNKDPSDTDDRKYFNVKSVNIMIHSEPMKRSSTGRSKDIHKLVAKHRTAKEQPPSLVPITSATFLIHSHNKTKNNISKSPSISATTESNYAVHNCSDEKSVKQESAHQKPPLLLHIATSQSSEDVKNRNQNKSTHTSTVIFPAECRSTICISNSVNVNSNVKQTSSQSLQIGGILPTIITAPVIVLGSNKSSQNIPTVNLNVNSESTLFNNVPSSMASESSHPPNVKIIADRQTPTLPVLLQVPMLQDKNDIKLMSSYPKPLVVSNFGTQKVGGTVVYSKKRVDLIRTEFKSMLSNKTRLLNAVPLKTVNLQSTTSGSVYEEKLINSNSKFSTKYSLVNSHSSVVYSRRPNILRTSVNKQTKEHTKTYMVGIKNHTILVNKQIKTD